MRYISPTNLTYLQGKYLTLCMCVKMTLRNGTVLGFTDLDQTLTISGLNYLPMVSVGAMRWGSNLDDEPTEINGIFSDTISGALIENNARLGLYNEADVEIFLANWSTSASIVPLKRGKLANITPQGVGYRAEVHSLFYALNKRVIVRALTHDCNAELGDSRCTKTRVTFNGTITGATKTTITASAFAGPATASDIHQGDFLLTSGSLTWFKNKIKNYDSGTKTFTFWIPFPAAPAIGSTFTAKEGCDLKPSTCKDRFNNIENYRGFHFTPEKDKIAIPKSAQMQNGGYVAGTGEDD